MRMTRDVLAGVLFVAIGLGTVVIASAYPLGTSARMGPGYFPIVLGGVVAVMGAGLFLRAVLDPESSNPVRGWAPRPLILILASILSFALAIRPLGLIGAIVPVVIVSRLAAPQVGLVETLIMAAVLSAICVVVFVYGLDMPFRLGPWE